MAFWTHPKERHLALLVNIRLGWKGLILINSLAYYDNYNRKEFYSSGHVCVIFSGIFCWKNWLRKRLKTKRQSNFNTARLFLSHLSSPPLSHRHIPPFSISLILLYLTRTHSLSLSLSHTHTHSCTHTYTQTHTHTHTNRDTYKLPSSPFLSLSIFLSIEVLLKGKLSTVDLLVLTSLDQLLFIMKVWFSFFSKHATLMRRPIVLSLLHQLLFPALSLILYIFLFVNILTTLFSPLLLSLSK